MSDYTGPLGAKGWRELAARVVESFPLAGSDWTAHSDAVESGFYAPGPALALQDWMGASVKAAESDGVLF